MSAEFNPPSQSASTLSPSGQALGLETFLQMAVAQGVSDIHLRVGCVPLFRKHGDIIPTQFPILDETTLLDFTQQIIPRRDIPELDFDFSFNLKGVARFRVNRFYEMDQIGLVLRVIPNEIPTLQSLGIPAIVERFTTLNKGLVLITGPTGCGKTTTLAALLNQINKTAQRHIITLEDPIEFVYENQKSLITQRQLGSDTLSFPDGVRAALRQDPNVILIGEMRDRETLLAALHAAETGHVVFSTLHTTDTVQTINRIINVFEPHEREPIRQQLAEVFQGALSQRLVRRADGNGRVAVSEVMMVTSTVRDYILHNKADEIYALLKQGSSDGMIDLNQALYRAYRSELINEKTALQSSENPGELQHMIRGAYHGTNQG